MGMKVDPVMVLGGVIQQPACCCMCGTTVGPVCVWVFGMHQRAVVNCAAQARNQFMHTVHISDEMKEVIEQHVPPPVSKVGA
jgi:hypothetical protein